MYYTVAFLADPPPYLLDLTPSQLVEYVLDAGAQPDVLASSPVPFNGDNDHVEEVRLPNGERYLVGRHPHNLYLSVDQCVAASA